MRRLLQSATINTWISIGVRMGGLALLLPLVLRYLDLQQVLIWQLQSSIMAMMLWIDFGLTPTFSRFIAVARGGGSLQDLRQTGKQELSTRGYPAEAGPALDLETMIGTSGRIYLAMALVGTLIIGLIGTLVMMGPVAALSNPVEGWKAWAFTAVAVPFALMNGNNASVLIGCDRITTLRRVESVIGLLQILSISMVVVVTENLAWIAASYTFWTVAGFALNRWQRQAVLRGQEGLAASDMPRVWNPEVLRVAWAAGWRSGVGVLLSTGIIQGTGMIMPQIASAEISAAYLLLLRLMTVASQLSQAPFYSRLPAMAKANAGGSRAEMVALAKYGLKLSLWTMVVGIFGILFIFPQALLWINGSVRMPPSSLSLLLALAFFAERYGAMHMQIYTLSNHVIWHRVNGLTGIAIIVAFALLWPMVGTVAMPMAMLGGYGLYLCPAISRRSLAFIGQDRWSFERETSLGPGLGLATCIALFFLVGWWQR